MHHVCLELCQHGECPVSGRHHVLAVGCQSTSKSGAKSLRRVTAEHAGFYGLQADLILPFAGVKVGMQVCHHIPVSPPCTCTQPRPSPTRLVHPSSSPPLLIPTSPHLKPTPPHPRPSSSSHLTHSSSIPCCCRFALRASRLLPRPGTKA